MIHHLSIAADEPERVAKVFAELLGGFVIPFPPQPGSFLAIGPDGHGTGVEVHPADTVLQPNGAEGARFGKATPDTPHSPVHFALSVETDAAHVSAIAAREGWLSTQCSRGGDFDVIELWIENRLLVEVMPPALAAQYLAFCRRMGAASRASALMASHTTQAVEFA